MSTDGSPVEVDELRSTGDLDVIANRRKRFAELTAQKRELKKTERTLLTELAELEGEIVEDYIELGTDTMRTIVGEDRYTVYLADECRAGPLKTGHDDERDEEVSTDDDWERACTALRAAGWGDLCREQFNHNALSGRLREFIEEHGPDWRDHLPEGVATALSIRVGKRVRCRKS